MTRKPPSGAVVKGIDFDRWAVVLCKPDATDRGLVDAVLERIEGAGMTVHARTELIAEPWQAHVAYRDLLADPARLPPDMPARLDKAYAGQPVTVALANGGPDIHARLRRLIGHTDPARAAPGTIRRDLGNDSVRAATRAKRLVRNLVHTSDDPAAALREYGIWYSAGRTLKVSDFARCAVILCKPDATDRGLVGEVLERIAMEATTVSYRREVIVQPWQAHVHYWDLLVDADHFPGRDIPACLDKEYAGRPVTVALAYGEPGLHARLRDALGHFDPTRAAPGTIRGDLGEDSLNAALATKRLVRNLAHTSDDPEAARRDFGTWYGAGRRDLLTPHLPAQSTSGDA
ncbi:MULTISPECIES: nucleoside-diphosphate kinase [unclassified Streptomyces]|uniref:nucleoside-diphosphate kinase n=1 Tax=Streptomyces sp. SYP-A7185 TaxID=3040076 RepID=UPI0038F7E34B